MSESEVERFLFGLRRFGVRPDLAPTRAALDALGAPDRAFQVVQVVGSVGKGSTAAGLAAILEAAGVRTGLFTSPHLVRLRERFRVDGADVTDAEIAEALDEVRTKVPWTVAGPAEDDRRFMAEPGALRPLTFFEWCTVLACVIFARRGVEVAVLEAGLGGRWDATTAVHAEATVITRLSLEHTEVLGDTLAAIAAEKAAAIRPGVPVITLEQAPEALAAVRARARAQVSPLHVLGRGFSLEPTEDGLRFVGRRSRVEGLVPALTGAHQRENLALALAAAETLAEEQRVALTPDAVRRGVASVRWPGRLEEVAPGLWVDGAHAPGAMRVLAEEAGRRFGAPLQVVFAVIGPRPVAEMLAPLLPLADTVVLTRVGGDRGRAPEGYADEVCRVHPRVEVREDPAEALDLARSRGGTVLACGSLYLVGAVKAALEGARVEVGDPQASCRTAS